MLVLSRKLNEEILIGDNVSIKVVGVFGNKVRLGISAPAAVTIRRAELIAQFLAAAAEQPLGPQPCEPAVACEVS